MIHISQQGRTWPYQVMSKNYTDAILLIKYLVNICSGFFLLIVFLASIMFVWTGYASCSVNGSGYNWTSFGGSKGPLLDQLDPPWKAIRTFLTR